MIKQIEKKVIASDTHTIFVVGSPDVIAELLSLASRINREQSEKVKSDDRPE